MLLAGAGASAAAAESDVLPLRVCADPGNMPLSNDKGEGFQNKVAEILANAMGAPLRYYWYPYYGRGLVRSTLTADNCDVLMDVPSDFEMALTTKPYYKSTFVLAYHKDGNHKIESLDDPILKKWRIGVLQSSPAREALRTHGVLENTEVQYAFFDSSYNPEDHPGRQVEEVIDHKLGAVETWGPIGGYYVKQKGAPLELLPLNRLDDGVPLEFAMAFGVRRADKDLKRRLDEAFEAHKGEIRAVLASYGVPLVKCEECVISGDLPEHGAYTTIAKAKAEARLDHPESSSTELASMKERIAAGADTTQELSDAVVGNDPDRVRYLLAHGADPNKVIQLDYNALQWAVREGHVKIAEILLDHGAKAEQRDKDGWSPLMFAVWRNNADMIRLLISKGAKLDAYGSGGWSPLSVAITYGGLDNVKQLVEAGADVNASNDAGYTPVMFATAKSADGVLDLLLKRGANVRAANKAGITSLMLAAAENNEAAAKVLLSAGADRTAKDLKGQTALAIAREKGNTQLTALLSQDH
ncbi:MAG: quinoprotein dehydrogenase-associated putative ABC transporter substrate-binding protein [Dokdonella sp.]